MGRFRVEKEGKWIGEWENATERKFGSYDEAIEWYGSQVDDGCDDDFRVVDEDNGTGWKIRWYKLKKVECPACGETMRGLDAMWTYDCHGITYRQVCPKCHDKIMGGRGYDGQYYTEADENLELDY